MKEDPPPLMTHSNWYKYNILFELYTTYTNSDSLFLYRRYHDHIYTSSVLEDCQELWDRVNFESVSLSAYRWTTVKSFTKTFYFFVYKL